MADHVGRFTTDPRDRMPVWHRLKRPSEWNDKQNAIGHPDDDYYAHCGKLLVKKFDGVASEKKDEAVVVARLPRGVKRCGNCFRKARA